MIGPSDIQIILGKVRPLSRPLTEAHPQVLIIAQLHYSPGNWWAVSDLCKRLWDTEPTIVVHYMPECDFIDELAAEELIRRAHLLTPARVVELDGESTNAQRAIDLQNRLSRCRAQSPVRDGLGL